MLGDRSRVDAVLDDFRSAPITEKERSLFSFIEMITTDAKRATQDGINELKRSGWTDDAIYDAVTVCALFQFYNTWADATGVADLPAAMYAMTGKRLAADGYASNE